jgi:hypothetical protein
MNDERRTKSPAVFFLIAACAVGCVIGFAVGYDVGETGQQQAEALDSIRHSAVVTR